MTCFKTVLFILILLSLNTRAELTKIEDHYLSQLTGQAGIVIDGTVPTSIDRAVFNTTGSEGLSVISGNLLDNDIRNDRAILNYQYQGLAIDVLSEGVLSIGLPRQFILGQKNLSTGHLENGLNASLYFSRSAEITPTTYQTNTQTYTAYINSISDDPVYKGFTLYISGNNINQSFNGNYIENLSISNTDGASFNFTITDADKINLVVKSDDRSDCGFFCDGTDDGEIILVDSKGDLVAVASTVGEDASLTNIAVNPLKIIDQQGSNFFISAKMKGTFNLTGSINVFSGTSVDYRP